jgi:hypothetical protein
MSPRRNEEVAPMATTTADVAGYRAFGGIRMSGAEFVRTNERDSRPSGTASWCGKAALGGAVLLASPKHVRLMVSVVTDVPTPIGVPPSVERRT